MNLFEPAANRRSISWQLCLFSLWVGATGFGLYLRPDPVGHGTHQELGFPPCPSALFLNRPCPGCGLTTSWTAFLHGQWSLAFHAHPLGPPLYFLFTAGAWLSVYGFVKLRRFNMDGPQVNRVLVACAAVFLAFGFTRMAVVSNYRSAVEQMYAQQLGIVRSR